MFRKWCRERKLNNGSNLSHVLMDGGVLSVPFDTLDEFYDRYVESVKSGEKVFVVEQKTELYNFFIDIDYKDDRALTVEEVEDVCRIICDKVKNLGGKDALVSVAPPKEAGSKIKTGVHINWPGFVVNQKSAIAVREHVLIALVTAKGGVDWDKVIDQSVYGEIKKDGRKRSRGSGFRMPWSHKIGKHDACEGKGCDECSKGRTTQVAYLPLFRYRQGPVFSMLERVDPQPNVDVLKMATVRTDATTAVVVDSPNRAAREGTFEEMEEVLAGEEITDLEIHDALERKIQTIPGQENATVKKVIKIEDTYLIASDSKYCFNIGRDHGSNHVYFVASNGGLRQKCHCKCETMVGRRVGFCKEFSTEPTVIAWSESLYAKLWPDGLKPQERLEKKKQEVAVDRETKKNVEGIINQFAGHQNTKVTRMQKKGKVWLVFTNTQYCAIRGTNHEAMMQFAIERGSGGSAYVRQDCECARDKKMRSRATKIRLDHGNGNEAYARLFRSSEKNRIM